MKKTKIIWDSSVFIAWFAEEKNKPLDTIALVVNEIEIQKTMLFVPAGIWAELLECKFTPDQYNKLEKFGKRTNVVSFAISESIARFAAKLREEALNEKPCKRSLKAADAMIVASAVLHGVNALHSFDPDILNIKGYKILNGLKISTPLPSDGATGLKLGI